MNDIRAAWQAICGGGSSIPKAILPPCERAVLAKATIHADDFRQRVTPI
jgi:hypothetical protein